MTYHDKHHGLHRPSHGDDGTGMSGSGLTADSLTSDSDLTAGLVGAAQPASSQAAAPASGGAADAPSLNAITPYESEVAYISGVTSSGTVAATSFHTWNNDSPPTYGTVSGAAKWGSPTPGTSGGTVTYYYDPASNWTGAEQAALREGLSLWSAVANISFAQTTNASTATLTFKRGTDGGAHEDTVAQTPSAVGSNQLGNQGHGASISIDTSVAGFGPLGSFSTIGGYPIQTVVHEEGHFLGLGHGGPYNGTVNEGTDQFSAYDSRLWTLMSYVNPETTSAKYYNSYPVTGTSLNGNYATTWMPLDIVAVQRLYGVASSTPLSGGQVFGFNTNITGDLQPFFDFTKNTNPVITLWDKGANNTLDLSGFGTTSTVNLNAGTFSSFDGMTNNVAIAFGTTIDTAIGGFGNDTFYINGDSDRIDGGGGANTVMFNGSYASYSVSASAGTLTVTPVGGGVTDTLLNIQTLHFTDQSVQSSAIACYARGTMILTDHGEIAVESLSIGDRIVTSCGAIEPIRWIGCRSYAGRFLAGRGELLPVCFRANALAEGVPHSDLWVSPLHAMLIDGLLVAALDLVNGDTIFQHAGADRVDYFHVELARHDVLLANGATSETFVDDDSRGMFHNAAEYDALYPGAARVPAVYCAPRITAGHALEAIRRRLDVRRGRALSVRAEPLRGCTTLVGAQIVEGWAQNPRAPDAPVCLDIVLDGEVQAVTLANGFDRSLAEAGLGSGRHKFAARLPVRLTASQMKRVEVRRSVDQRPLPRAVAIAA